MFDEINNAFGGYMGKWQGFVAQRQNKDLFDRLKPTAVGWKVADLAEHDRVVNELRGACDQVVAVWMNDRWITKLHLKDSQLNGGVEIIKILQLRPGSTDAVGLDHVDFMDMEETNTRAILEEEGVKFTDEENGPHCTWTSIWFDNTEAKLRRGTVLDVIISELDETNNKIRGQKFANPIGDGSAAHVSEVE